MRLRLHPSVATLASAYAVVTVWAAHQTEGGLAALDPGMPKRMVLRQGLNVKVFAIDAGSVAFIHSLNQGAALEIAVERMPWRPAMTRPAPVPVTADQPHAITHLLPERKVSP